MHICTHCVWLKCLSNWSQWDIIFTDKDTKLRWKEIMLSIKTLLPSIIFAAIWILPIAILITYLWMIHSLRYIKAYIDFNVTYSWYTTSNYIISAVQPVSDHLHFYPTINTMMDTLRKIWNVINHCSHLQTVRVSDSYFFAQKRKYFISLRKVNQAMHRRRMVNTC